MNIGIDLWKSNTNKTFLYLAQFMPRVYFILVMNTLLNSISHFMFRKHSFQVVIMLPSKIEEYTKNTHTKFEDAPIDAIFVFNIIADHKFVFGIELRNLWHDANGKTIKIPFI